LYLGSKQQIEVLLVELRKLRTQHTEFKFVIDLLERFLIDFDKLAAVQRIIAVPTEKIVEKEVDRAVLVPTKDSEIIRNELALSVLIEKLILEIKRIKKENSSLKLNLDDDVLLVFFTELYDQQFKSQTSFSQSLKEYTQTAVSKFTQMGGNWTYDHELMLNTILEERFAMANLVKQANLEIEKVKTISDKRAVALREKETQFLQISKQLSEFHKVVGDLYQTTEGRRILSGSSSFSKLFTDLDQWISSSFVVRLDEPVKILGDFVGSGNEWNRVQSLLREREREIEVLRLRILEIEKASLKRGTSSSGSENTIAFLRQENERLTRELNTLRTSTSSRGDENTIAFLRQENERLNGQVSSLQASISSSSNTSRGQEQTIASLRIENEKLSQQIVTLQTTISTTKTTTTTTSKGDENTIAFLKQENERLNGEITRLRGELANAGSSSQVRELEIKLKTAQSRIEELESQVRNYELQLRQFKDSKSSAASSVGDGQSSSRIQMTESQYSSSSSSSNKYVSGGSTYQTPSYGQTYTSGLTGSAVKDSTSTTTYGTTGLTSYGTTGTTSYGTTGTTGTTYGTTGTTSTTYGTSGTSALNTGSRVLGQNTTSTYERKSNLGSSGVSGSGYSFQTKKY
jgi:hypothetical protein